LIFTANLPLGLEEKKLKIQETNVKDRGLLRLKRVNGELSSLSSVTPDLRLFLEGRVTTELIEKTS
jgi:hypothetical protein